ncbi:MAG: Smr/MutS family protein [Hyphomonadaceae bacterium]
MSRKQRDLTTEEKRLWRRVAASVKTRKPAPAAEEPDSSTPAARRAAHAPLPLPLPPPAPSRPEPTAPPHVRSNEKRVRRGKLEIGATLDLHGYTHDPARGAVERCLRSAHARGERTVLIVTGAGRGGEGVLKRAFPGWLSAPGLRPLIAGYAQAHRSHGGSGAFYVFLKRPK